MATSVIPTNLTFTSSANYRICVKGFLDASWSDRLVGMTIDNQVADNTSPIVALCGQVRDQGELLGLLNSLYEMHLPLMSVVLIEGESKNSKPKE